MDRRILANIQLMVVDVAIVIAVIVSDVDEITQVVVVITCVVACFYYRCRCPSH